MRKLQLLIVLAVAVTMMLVFSAKAFACSNPCPRGQNCIEMCFPDIFTIR